MKTLSGTFAFKLVVLAAVAVIAVLAFRAFMQKDEATFVLKIQKVTPVKNEADFENVLRNLKTQLYEIYVIDERGNRRKIVPSTTRSPSSAQSTLNINTDKITTSELALAKKDVGGNDVSPSGTVTYKVLSMSAEDIKDVLDQLQ